MSHRLNPNRFPWTPEEDAILTTCWRNPDIDYRAIAKALHVSRTAEAVQIRGIELGLGEKARPKKARKSAKKLTPWPDDMPKFEDHPCASGPGSRARAAQKGSRFKLVSHHMESSLTGSSLDGASPQGLVSDD